MILGAVAVLIIFDKYSALGLKYVGTFLFWDYIWTMSAQMFCLHLINILSVFKMAPFKEVLKDCHVYFLYNLAALLQI